MFFCWFFDEMFVECDGLNDGCEDLEGGRDGFEGMKDGLFMFLEVFVIGKGEGFDNGEEGDEVGT